MNQWSRRRKRIILSVVVFVFIALVGVPVFVLFYRAPTCFDGKRSGSETGIDCGGSCQLLCSAESLPLLLKGDPRVLKVRDNDFEVVALVENPNFSAEIYRAQYVLKLFAAGSIIPIKVVEGETYVPRDATFAVFEGPFILEAGVIPTRATLEWREESLAWRKNALPAPMLVIRNTNLSRQDISPRLDADVENVSLENVSNIELVALISNESANIFAASKSFVDILPAGLRAPVVFTWPEPFGDQSVHVDIIVRVFPDRSFIQ